jgi:hypothetical protein
MAMMFRLISNVGHNGIGLRFANGKTGILALPSEILEALRFQASAKNCS